MAATFDSPCVLIICRLYVPRAVPSLVALGGMHAEPCAVWVAWPASAPMVTSVLAACSWGVVRVVDIGSNRDDRSHMLKLQVQGSHI